MPSKTTISTALVQYSVKFLAHQLKDKCIVFRIPVCTRKATIHKTIKAHRRQ